MRHDKYAMDYGPSSGSLREMLMPGETVLWTGKPKKSAFVLNKCLLMAPVALIWLCFDGFFIAMTVSDGFGGGMGFFLIPFFLLHLMPVWIWLGNIFTASRRWQNTEYAVTDKRILIKNGFVGVNYQTIYYTDIANVELRIGLIDRLLGVGDIYLQLPMHSSGKSSGPVILDIDEPEEIYRRIQRIVLDIQSDIHYPNDLRPNENPGYQTRYTPRS